MADRAASRNCLGATRVPHQVSARHAAAFTNIGVLSLTQLISRRSTRRRTSERRRLARAFKARALFKFCAFESAIQRVGRAVE
jgi:hypothetical protein